MNENETGTRKPPGKRARKRPRNAPCHVMSFPLVVTEADRRRLDLRFRAAAILRNGCIGESLKRLDSMRADTRYAAARLIPKDEDHRDERREAFADLRTAFGFTKASMESYARAIRDRFWVKDHLGGHDTQTIAATAFAAAERHAFGRGGRPSFKKLDALRSIASKDASNIMRLRGDPAHGPEDMRFEYRGLSLRIRRRTFSVSELHSLSQQTLRLRIVRKRDTARERFVVQITVDGKPFVHRERRPGHVGIDVGPSTIAAVSMKDQMVETFCNDVVRPWKDIARLQRRVDRSFRAANADCFREDGSFIKGSRPRGRSKTLLRLRAQLRRKEGKLARKRANAHGRSTNRILGQGTTIHAEKLSHVAFQKIYGRSVAVRAPGAHHALLERKAKEAGGGIIEIPTWRSKLSQFDHASGDCVKKPLSLRRHAMRDGSGVVVDRDVYSAFLALHCDASGVVDVDAAKRHWESGACGRLAAASKDAEPARGQGFPLPPVTRGSKPAERRSRSPRRRAASASGTCKGRGGMSPVALEGRGTSRTRCDESR